MPVCIHQDDERPLAGGSLGLRPLRLVVGEGEIGAASVDLEAVAEVGHRHRRTLDVPSRPPWTPRRLPRGLVGQRALPEHEVERIALPGHVRHVAALVGDREHLVPRHVRDLAEGRIGRDAEVDLAVGRVREPGVQQLLDEGDHLRHVLGRARQVVGRQPVEAGHLGQEGRHPAVAEGEVVLAGLARLPQHVVVDIGQVLHVDDVVAEVLQVPMQDVEADVRERVAEVPGVVRRHAAHVEADVIASRNRFEGVETATAGVVQAQGHAADSKAGAARLPSGAGRGR